MYRHFACYCHLRLTKTIQVWLSHPHFTHEEAQAWGGAESCPVHIATSARFQSHARHYSQLMAFPTAGCVMSRPVPQQGLWTPTCRLSGVTPGCDTSPGSSPSCTSFKLALLELPCDFLFESEWQRCPQVPMAKSPLHTQILIQGLCFVFLWSGPSDEFSSPLAP